MECGGFEGEAAVRVGAVGSVEVSGVEVGEEYPRTAPDLVDVVEPPPRQAQHPVPEALGLRRAAAHEDEPGRRRRGGGARAGRGSGGGDRETHRVGRRLRLRALTRPRRGRRGGRVLRHGSGLGLFACPLLFPCRVVRRWNLGEN